MDTRKLTNPLPAQRRRGFAHADLCWLIACLTVGGFLIAKGFATHRPHQGPAAHAPSAPARWAPAAAAAHGYATRTKNIEDVQAGERVWACDPATGEWSPRVVERPLAHLYEGDLITVSVAGQRIEATNRHPFWVVSGEELAVAIGMQSEAG